MREGEDYYGSDGPYRIMAGRDASRAFAMMSLKEEDANADMTDVPPDHLKILDDWCRPARRPVSRVAADARVSAARASTRVLIAAGQPTVLACRRYDKLTKKYPTVGCSAGNKFGYSLAQIDVGAEEARAKEAEERMAKEAAGEDPDAIKRD